MGEKNQGIATPQPAKRTGVLKGNERKNKKKVKNTGEGKILHHTEKL